MSDNLKITITGTNNASPAFKQVAADAQHMGTTVEQAGQRSARSFDDFNRRAFAVGAGIGTLTGLMSDFSRQSIEDEANQQRLQQAVENTGKSYDQYSLAIEKAISQGQKRAFTDDQVRDALVRLNAVTNDTSASLNELSLVEDFARARGIDLATSADIIGKVMGGNLGILSRYGIQLGDNATKEQALAKIQQISAGQADTYAQTTQGKLDSMRVGWDELTESIGRHTGALQGLLAVLPGLSAGFVGLSSAIGGLGGAAGLGGIAVAATQLAGLGALGTIAYGYSQNDVGTTFANDLANKIFLVMSEMLNAAIPGSPFDPQKYRDQMAENTTWDSILSVFGSPSAAGKALNVQGSPGIPLGSSVGYGGAVDPVTGQPIGYQIPGGAIEGPVPNQPPTDSQVYDAINANAAALGLTVSQYLALPSVKLAGIIARATPGQGNVYGTGSQSLAGANTPPPPGTAGSAFPDWVGLKPGTSSGYMYGEGTQQSITASAGGSGAVANDISGRVATGHGGGISNYTGQEIANQSLAGTKELNDELTKRVGIFANLVNGQETWNDAQSQFKYVQDGIITQETVYSQQLSEYSGQVDAITKAHDLLNQKVADGGTLTKEQADFQDHYNEALERGNGAIDDATISQGLLAEQYLLNMQQGDKLNQTMQDQTGAVGDLVDVVQMLIDNLFGIPTDVKASIELYGADYALQMARDLQYALESAAGTYVANFIVTTTGGNAPEGPTLPAGARNGGVVGYANGGIVIEAGEAGPELMHFAGGGVALAPYRGLYNVPRGTYVDTAPATKQKLGSMGGVTIQQAIFQFSGFTTKQEVNRQIQEFAVGGSRS